MLTFPSLKPGLFSCLSWCSLNTCVLFQSKIFYINLQEKCFLAMSIALLGSNSSVRVNKHAKKVNTRVRRNASRNGSCAIRRRCERCLILHEFKVKQPLA